MVIYPAAFGRLIAPALLVGAVLWARPLVELLPEERRLLLANLPYLIAACNLIVGYQFRRLRLMLAAGGLAALYWLIQSRLQVSLTRVGAADLYLAASLALPLLTLYLLLVPERGVLTGHALLTALLFLGLLGLCFPLAGWLRADPHLSAYFAARTVDGYVLSVGASALAVVTILVGLALLLLRNSDVDAALLGALLSGGAALAWLFLDHISVVTAVAGQLCLAWGLLRCSHAMAYRDDLTGLLSRRALNERLKTLGGRYCIAMLDIDHFKRLNDTHGHDVGDEVLRLVASRVKRVGQGGTAYRYGGEEFCIVFPRRDRDDCAAALNGLREGIAGYRLSIRDRSRRPRKAREGSRRRGATRLHPDQISVTISAGLASRDEKGAGPDSVIRAADNKLYRAKQAGRNRLVY